MIDIELIRTQLEKVRESEKNRFRKVELVDKVAELDQNWRKLRFQVDQLNKQLNKMQQDIASVCKLKKKTQNRKTNDQKSLSKDSFDQENSQETSLTKNDADLTLNNLTIQNASVIENKNDFTVDKSCSVLEIEYEKLINERNLVKNQKDEKFQEMERAEKELFQNLNSIGNILHPSVVISNNEDDNKIIFTYQTPRECSKMLPFHEICQKIDGCDTLRGSRISGHRGYFLQNDLALLALSLSRYAIDFMLKRNFTFIQTPVFMQKEIMAKTAQLSDFDDQLYGFDNNFLIATSEQPLSAYFLNEVVNGPVRFVGQSLCFRKEAGAHGKDNAGIFRVHQFEKIEQFVICEAEDSEGFFEDMMQNARDFYESLEISYRVVSIVSGELNDAASIKYDLEAYFPNAQKFRELVSCSNCTDYQSRNLGVKTKHQKKFAHMLNCTLTAVQRTLCCLVENYQEEDGVRIPRVLVPYMGKKFIEYKQ